MAVERGLGYQPTDREFEKRGYDIESRDPGRWPPPLHRGQGTRERRGQPSPSPATRSSTRSTSPTSYILAIVEFLENGDHYVHYLRRPFQREPDFGVTSVNYSFAELLERAPKSRVRLGRPVCQERYLREEGSCMVKGKKQFTA